MYNNQNSNFLNLFKGTVKPVMRKPAATPVVDRNVIIGKDGDLFTRCRMWIYEPTTQYPEISIFLQLKNASGSTFTKLKLEDIELLQSTIAGWYQAISAIMPALSQKLAQVNAYIDQYETYRQLAEEIVQSNMESGGGGEVNHIEDDEDEEPPKRTRRRT